LKAQEEPFKGGRTKSGELKPKNRLSKEESQRADNSSPRRNFYMRNHKEQITPVQEETFI
jgi:hypothetical protein